PAFAATALAFAFAFAPSGTSPNGRALALATGDDRVRVVFRFSNWRGFDSDAPASASPPPAPSPRSARRRRGPKLAGRRLERYLRRPEDRGRGSIEGFEEGAGPGPPPRRGSRKDPSSASLRRSPVDEMNDTTLPIPKGRGGSGGGANANPGANPRRRARPPEGKVRKGFGLHDWTVLLRRSRDLAQRKGAPIRRCIPLEEIKRHDKPYDGWIVLRGKVYNVAPYLAYHPGGSKIVEKCLGNDATSLFDKYHPWVNVDNLIGPLLLGYAEVEKRRGDDDEEERGYLKGGAAAGGNDVVLPSVDEEEGEEEDPLKL
ncbi:hypothetical protein ACHAWF_008714, partial [Thalassiosira exigua]